MTTTRTAVHQFCQWQRNLMSASETHHVARINTLTMAWHNHRFRDTLKLFYHGYRPSLKQASLKGQRFARLSLTVLQILAGSSPAFKSLSFIQVRTSSARIRGFSTKAGSKV